MASTSESGLRIVLLGKNESENNKVANIILDTTAFQGKTPSQSQHLNERISGALEMIHITVIKSHLLKPHLSKHQIIKGVKECVSLSAPGPHSIVLVLQYKDVTEEYVKRVNYVLNLVSKQAFRHTIVVTTDEDTLTTRFTKMWNNPIDNLMKECEGGHLKFDSKKLEWGSEIVKMIKDILYKENEQFIICNVYDDDGSSVDGDDKKEAEDPVESTKPGHDGGVATTGKAKLNFVICGNNSTLKTSVSKVFRGTINKQKNTILPQKERSNVCVKKEDKNHGRLISVIELPALTQLSEEEVMCQTQQCVCLCDPGVHVFILVTPVRLLTEEDKAEMEKINRIFNSKEHFMVLFTTELTVDKSVTDFVESAESKRIVSLYGSWYSVMGLKDQRSSELISELFKSIETLKTEPYSLQMYMKAPERRRVKELEEKLSEKDNEIKELQQKIKTLAPEGVKLNLVVCGSNSELKSFISNLILNQSEERSQLSSECVRRDVELDGRLISLVELPALFNTQLSEEEVMHQIHRCVSLFHPGVHAFLLILPDGPINNEDKAEIERIQRIFSSKINKHIMILIMIKQNSEQQTVELNDETQSVIESFGGQQIFVGPNTQGSDLVEKLEEMVAENSGECFSTETLLDVQMEKLRTFEEMKRRIHSLETWFQTQDSGNTEDELRIVLLGKTGVGKSSTGNTILGREAYISDISVNSVTKVCQKVTHEINSRQITVIDTPGLFDTELSNEEIQREIRNCISMILPGPHVFLLLIPLGRFTQEEEKSVKIIQETFGENSLMYTIVLFTNGDKLKNKTIEQVLANPGSALKNLIVACGNRFHVFNNETKDRTQVTDLLEKIDEMVKANGGSYYSCKMFREMEREIQEKQNKILMEKVENLNREKEEMMKKHKEEKKKLKTKMEEDLNKEKKRREEEFSEREDRYKSDINYIEEKEKKIREDLQQERRRREEEEEKWRKKEQAMWNEYDQSLKRIKTMMKEERQNRDTERKRVEEKYIKEQFKRDIENIEDQERNIREELKRERDEWEKYKQQEIQREEEEKTPDAQHLKNDEDTPSDPECLRILLFGRKGSGKSAAVKTILGKNGFDSKDSSCLVTTACTKVTGKVDGRSIAVIDTPGLFDSSLTMEQVQEEIMTCISLSAPGPHVIIIVFDMWKITKEEKDTLEVITKIFGSEANNFSIVLYTRGDKLKNNQTIEQYVQKYKNDELDKLIRDRGNRFLAFNNTETQDQAQVKKLLNIIEEIKDNQGFFTNEMFDQETVSIKQRIKMLKESEIEKQAHVKELTAKYDMEDRITRKRLEEKKQRRDEETERLKKKFREQEEILRRVFEEKEKSEQEKQEKQEIEDQKQSELGKQQKDEYDQRIEEIKREYEDQITQYENQLKEREEEDKTREEKYKQDQENMKNYHQRIMAELKMKQEEEIKKTESEEQVMKDKEEKEREDWGRKLKEAENDEKTKRKQIEWEEENKRQMMEQKEDERKRKERHEKQLREKQEELENKEKKCQSEREEERQRREEEKQQQVREREKKYREYEEKKNEMERHYEQLEQERKEEWRIRRQENEEKRVAKRKRWEKMMEDVKQEQNEEIRRREREETERIDREEKECDRIKQTHEKEIENMKKVDEQVQELKEKIDKIYDEEKKRRGKCHVM